MKSLVSSIVFLLAITSKINGKISGKIDLAIVIPASHDYDKFHKPFKASMPSLSKWVDIGKDKVRVAIVDCVNSQGVHVKDADILFPTPPGVSGDENAYLDFVKRWKPMTWKNEPSYHHDKALRKIREEIFDFTDASRAKIVILIMNGFAADPPAVREEASKLRDKGVFIYGIYHRDQKLAVEIKDYVTNHQGAYSIPGNEHEKLYSEGITHIEKLEPTIKTDLCTSCVINSGGTCGAGTRPTSSKIDYFDDKNQGCQSAKPDPSFKCPVERCETECDNVWPWASNCNVSCGNISRSSSSPPAGMDNCPRVLICDPARECTTTTGPTTIVAETSKMVPPKTGPGDGGTPKNGTGESAKEDEKDKADGKDSNWWIWVTIGLVILVLLIIIIVVVVIVMKRKRAKKAEEEKLKKERMEKEKAEMLKKKMAEADASKMGGKKSDGSLLFMGRGGKGADTSVGADISEKGSSKSPKSTKGAPKGKTGPSKSEKSAPKAPGKKAGLKKK